jgi:hypothetical protein
VVVNGDGDDHVRPDGAGYHGRPVAAHDPTPAVAMACVRSTPAEHLQRAESTATFSLLGE